MGGGALFSDLWPEVAFECSILRLYAAIGPVADDREHLDSARANDDGVPLAVGFASSGVRGERD